MDLCSFPFAYGRTIQCMSMEIYNFFGVWHEGSLECFNSFPIKAGREMGNLWEWELEMAVPFSFCSAYDCTVIPQSLTDVDCSLCRLDCNSIIAIVEMKSPTCRSLYIYICIFLFIYIASLVSGLFY